jgi:hypothetical protein
MSVTASGVIAVVAAAAPAVAKMRPEPATNVTRVARFKRFMPVESSAQPSRIRPTLAELLPQPPGNPYVERL